MHRATGYLAKAVDCPLNLSGCVTVWVSMVGVWPGGGLTVPSLCGYLCHGSLTSTLPHSSPSLTIFSSLLCPSQSNWSSTAISLCLFIYCFLTRLLFVLIFFLPFLPTSPLFFPPSFVCSRVMVCCGLSTQRNNISGVGKVQPHMSCAAEGRLCEVRPIPHGSYSSRPRDQRPAISLPSPSSSASSSFHDH